MALVSSPPRSFDDEMCDDTMEEYLPTISRVQQSFPVALFGYQRAASLSIASGFRDIIRNYAVLESYCDGAETSAFDPFGYSVDVPLEEALRSPTVICNRKPLVMLPGRQISSSSLKTMWCRLVSHYFEWSAGVPELKLMSDKDKILLVTRQLCKIICFTISYKTFASGILRGIYFSCGITYFPDESIDPIIRAYMHNLCSLLESQVVLPFRRLRVTHDEYILTKIILFLSQTETIPLSTEGRELVTSALSKYQHALCEVCSREQTQLDREGLLARIAGIMDILPHLETASEVDDRHLMELTLRNEGDIQGRLTTEIHVLSRM